MEKIKIIQQEVSSYLSKLTPFQVEQLIQDYHEKELKVSEIIKKYNLEPIKYSNKFKKHLPSIQHPDNICPKCNTQSIVTHICRGTISNPFCPTCLVSMYEDYDPANRIEYIEFEKLSKEQEELHWQNNSSYFSNESNIVDVTLNIYEGLPFDVKVFLGSLVANGISEDFKQIDGWGIRDLKFYPKESTIELYLAELGQLNKMIFELKFTFETEVARKLIFPKDRLGLSIQEQYSLWKKIVLDEACELLEFQMNDSGFKLTQGEMVNEIFSELMEEYSLGQIYHLIYSSVNSACKFYSKKGNRSYAANTVIHNCRNSGVRYKSNDWTLKPYNRPYTCKQSELSKYYFDSVLKIGENGFNLRPSIETLTIDKFNLL